MQVKVLKGFVDSDTGQWHKPKDVFECSEKRFNEMVENAKKLGTEKYVEKVVKGK